MKKIISILAFAMVTMTAGLALATEFDDWKLSARGIYPGLEVNQAVMGSEVIGTAAGGIREERALKDGSAIFDSMLTVNPDVAFDSIPVALLRTGDGTTGRAAGGVRGDTDKGSRIFNEMLHPKINTYFDAAS